MLLWVSVSKVVKRFHCSPFFSLLLPLRLHKMAVDSRPSLRSITSINTHSWMACIEPGLEGDAGEYRGHQWTPPTRERSPHWPPSEQPKTRRINSLVNPLVGPCSRHPSFLQPLKSELIAPWIPLLCYWETDYLFRLGKSLSINERVSICQAVQLSAWATLSWKSGNDSGKYFYRYIPS